MMPARRVGARLRGLRPYALTFHYGWEFECPGYAYEYEEELEDELKSHYAGITGVLWQPEVKQTALLDRCVGMLTIQMDEVFLPKAKLDEFLRYPWDIEDVGTPMFLPLPNRSVAVDLITGEEHWFWPSR
jgi:hypothetical protein